MTELPEGWADAILQEICEFNPRHPTHTNRGQMVSFVPMPTVSDILGVIQDHEPRPLNEIWKGYTHFKDGDVIFAKITPCMENGKIAVASSLHNGLACGSTEFHVLRPYDGISARLIWYFLRRKSFRRKAERFMTGAVGQRRVPVQYLQETVYRVPPTSEQHRIVAKLDALFARTRQAREELEHIPALIEHYKQAILSIAYDWAAESATQAAKLGDILIEIRNGLGKPPEHTPPGVPILKISAIRPMTVRMDERRYYVSDEGEDISRYTLQSGDLLFTRYNGNPDFVASCGMIRELDEVLVYPDKLIRVRLDLENVDPRFVEAIASSPQARASLSPFIKSAAGQHGISGKDLKQLPLPIPSLSVQREIVDFVDLALSRSSLTQDESLSASHLLDHLEQATLAKAFRGELVPQDPNDEPASALLERIREARAEQSNGGKRKKKE
jgi:type I restriction enzyme S subunit